jgi:hypothetical protein
VHMSGGTECPTQVMTESARKQLPGSELAKVKIKGAAASDPHRAKRPFVAFRFEEARMRLTAALNSTRNG